MDAAEKLKRHYDRVITLWQKKHLRMRQNMIFATIRVVKSWDFAQFLSMGKEQRTAIRRYVVEMYANPNSNRVECRTHFITKKFI